MISPSAAPASSARDWHKALPSAVLRLRAAPTDHVMSFIQAVVCKRLDLLRLVNTVSADGLLIYEEKFRAKLISLRAIPLRYRSYKR
jgi:hypothetical protein